MFYEQHRKTPDGKVIAGCKHTSLLLNHRERNKIIINTATKLRKIKDHFDSIVCCGTSGILIAPSVAEILDKNIIIVRKQKDICYSPFSCEGATPTSYVIVDDLICSGNTIRHIIKTINEDSRKAKCIGVYSYITDDCAYFLAPDLCRRELGIEYLNTPN